MSTMAAIGAGQLRETGYKEKSNAAVGPGKRRVQIVIEALGRAGGDQRGLVASFGLHQNLTKGEDKKMLAFNNIYNMDCMQAMKNIPDKYFDFAVVDPEYGQEQHGGKDRSSWVTQKNGKSTFVPDGGYDNRGWDYMPASAAYFDELLRVSKNQVIWE